jgi:uncharacterized membrane protein
MKELTATLIPGSSALFEPGQKSDAGQGHGTGRAEGNRRQILKNSLSHEDEAKLQTALSAAKS